MIDNFKPLPTPTECLAIEESSVRLFDALLADPNLSGEHRTRYERLRDRHVRQVARWLEIVARSEVTA